MEVLSSSVFGPVFGGEIFDMTRKRVTLCLMSSMCLSTSLRSYTSAASSLAMAAAPSSLAAISAALAVLVASSTGTPGMLASSHLRHWAIGWGWEYIFFIFALSPLLDIR